LFPIWYLSFIPTYLLLHAKLFQNSTYNSVDGCNFSQNKHFELSLTGLSLELICRSNLAVRVGFFFFKF
jgi:hypothetical protein